MPHVIVMLWPEKSEDQKTRLAQDITQAVMKNLDYGEASVSISFEEVPASDWLRDVYEPDIEAKSDQLYKKPGYARGDLPQ